MTQKEQTQAKDARIAALLLSGRYEARPCGAVLSHRYKGHKGKTAVMKPRVTANGYFAVSLVDDEGVMSCFVHRIIAIGLIPNPLNLPEVNHKNGSKTDNATGNLEWTTPQENTAHAEKAGLRVNKANGSKLPQSKLTEVSAREIKRRLASGARQVDLAREFGIDQATVWAIKAEKTWRHV